MLDQGIPPSCGLTLPTAESESQASTLELTECPRLAGFQEVQPPVALPCHSQTLYAHMHAHTHTYTHGHTLVPWHSCGSQELESLQLAPPSVFLSSSRFLPPQALSRQSCGGDFFGGWGVGNKRLELNCNGQNPHEELRCQVGNKAWPASHAAGRCHRTGG